MYDPDQHHRRSIRLKGYDYSQSGAYFVTICVPGLRFLFGNVVNGEMRLNDAGRMIQATWEQLPQRFPTMEADAFVVMPNHFHAVVVIDAITDVGQLPLQGQPQGIAPTKKPTLGDIVGAFKSITTVEYTRGVRQVHWLPFEGRLWQRNYYEHIVRSEKALNHIREYIETNPARWDFDRENPNRKDVDEFERWLEAHSTARRW